MNSWDNSRDMQFLEYYRAEGALWNPRDASHKDVVRRTEAWERIAKCLGVPVKDLKRKKESLMSTYRKIRRGQAGEEAARPSWFAYEYMDEFLGDVRYQRPPGGAGGEHHEPRDARPVKREAENQEDADNEEEGETYFYVPPPEAKRRRDPLQSEAMAYVRQAVQLLGLALKGQTDEDDCDLYCKLLAARLRKLPDVDRFETMHKIDSLLLKRLVSSQEVYLEEDGLET